MADGDGLGAEWPQRDSVLASMSQFMGLLGSLGVGDRHKQLFAAGACPRGINLGVVRPWNTKPPCVQQLSDSIQPASLPVSLALSGPSLPSSLSLPLSLSACLPLCIPQCLSLSQHVSLVSVPFLAPHVTTVLASQEL